MTNLAITGDKLEDLDAITPGTYGNQFTVLRLSIDKKGRVVGYAETSILITSENIENLSLLNEDIADGTITISKIDPEGNTNRVLGINQNGQVFWEDRDNFVSSDLSQDNIYIGNADDFAENLPVGGDITATNTGTEADLQINTGAVESNEILDESIAAVDIGTDAVDSDEIAESAVGTSEIEDLSIQTIDIADDAVTKEKINEDVAGEGLSQNPTDGSLQVNLGNGIAFDNDTLVADLGAIAGDGLVENSGVLDVNVDNVTLETNADIVRIKAEGVRNNELAPDAVTSDKILDNEVSSADIENGTIINEDVNAAAAIEGTKINPDFGSQDVTTTGTITGGTLTDGSFTTTSGVVSGVNSIDIDNINIDGNTISSTNADGPIVLDPTGNGIVDVNSSLVSNVNDPVDPQDAATKNYVDDEISNSITADNGVRENPDGNIQLGGDLTETTTDIGVVSGTTLSISDDADNTTVSFDENGDITIGNGNLSVGTGQVDFDGNVDTNAGLDVIGLLRADDNVTLGSDNTDDLVVNANADFNDVVNVDGNVTLNGDVTLGDASGDQITASGNLNADNGVDITNADLTVGGTNFTVDDATGDVETVGSVDISTNLSFDAGQNVDNIVTSVGEPGLDTNLPTEQAVREAIDAEDLTDGEGTSVGSDGTSVNIGGGNAFSASRTIDVDVNTLTVQTDAAETGGLQISDGTDISIIKPSAADLAGTLDVEGATTLDQVTVNTTDGAFAIAGPGNVDVDATNNSIDLTTNSTGDINITAAGDINLSGTAVNLGSDAVQTSEIQDDQVNAAKIASDVAGDGLSQNTGDGSLQVNVSNGGGLAVVSDSLRLNIVPNQDEILIGDATNGFVNAVVSGDVEITTDGTNITSAIDATNSALIVSGDEQITFSTSSTTSPAIGLNASAGDLDLIGDQGILIDAPSGSIDIQLGTDDNSTSLDVLNDSGGTPLLSVDGAGATYINGDDINIGNDNTDAIDLTGITNINGGNLTIADGATQTNINNNDINIGNALDDAISLNGSLDSDVVFEGATADANETTLTVVDPDADRTITLPNASGTVVLTGAALNDDLAVTTDASGQLINAVDAEGFNVESNLINIGNDNTDAIDLTGITNINGGNLTIADGATQTNINNNDINIGNAPDDAISLNGSLDSDVVFEGATADANETTLTVADPDADRTITLPNASGTVVLTGAALNDDLAVTTDASGQLINAVDAEGFNVESNLINIGNDNTDAIDLTGITNINGGNLTIADGATQTNINNNDINIGNALDDAISLNGSLDSDVVFEGATADANETTLTVVDPDADRTITLPNASGTVVLTGAALNDDLAVTTDASGQLINAVDAEGFNVESNLINIGNDNTDAIDLTGITNINGGNLTIADGATQTNINNNDINIGNALDDAISLNGSLDSDVVFEGVTADANETTLTVADPDADRTITLPNASGTVVLTGAALNDDLAVTTDASGQLINAVDAEGFNVESNLINIGNDNTDAIDLTGITNINGGNLTIADGATQTNINNNDINIGNAPDDAISLNGSLDSDVVFEGVTADANETTLTVVDPDADRTITLPNASGTVVLTGAALNDDLAVTTDASGQLINAVDAEGFNVESNLINIGNDNTDAIDLTGITNINGGNLTIADGATQTNINNNDINIGNALDDAISLNGSLDSDVVFEGVTADANETTLTVVDPDADRTITLPNASGTVVLTGAALNDDLAVTTDASGQLINAVDAEGFNVESNLINIGNDNTDAIDLTGITNINGGNLTIADGATQTNINNNDINIGNALDDAISLNGSLDSDVVFEGATADANETTLTVADPDADRTITLPNASGTVVLTGAALNDDLAVTTDASGQLINAVDAEGFNVESNLINIGNDNTDAIDLTGITNINGGNLTIADGATQTNINNNDINIGNAPDDAISLNGSLDSDVVFEGATADANETTLTVADPDADRTITLPNASGTVVLTGAALNDDLAVTTDASGQLINAVDAEGFNVESNLINIGNDNTDAIDLTGITNINGGNLTIADGATQTNINNNDINIGNALDDAISLNGSLDSDVVFEGATADANETTLTVVDPDADRTITLPNASGTVVLTGAALNDDLAVTTDASGQLINAVDAEGFNVESNLINIGNDNTDAIDLTGITNINGGNLTIADGATQTNINNNDINIGNALDDAISLNGSLDSDVVFEGVTADANETTLTVADPDADRTITLPNASGTVVLTGAALNDDLAVTTDASGQLINAVDAEGFNVESNLINIGNDNTDAIDLTGITNINGGNLTIADGATQTNINNNDINIGNAPDDAISLNGSLDSDVVFEGVTADANETTLTVVDPDADRTITLPNASGTVVLTGAALNDDLAVTTDASGQLINAVDAEGFNVESNLINIGNDNTDAIDLTGITNINGGNLTIADGATQTNINNNDINIGNAPDDAISLNGSLDSDVVFEGATADANETTLTVADPDADRTITLPNASGTVVLTGAALNDDLAVTTDASGQLINAVDAEGFNVESNLINIGNDNTDAIDLTGITNINGGNLTIADGATQTNINNNDINIGNALDDAISLNGSLDSDVVFEGATADANETTLTVADPDADRTITLPNASGTVVLTGAALNDDLAVTTDASGQLINAVDAEGFNVESNLINIGNDNTDITTLTGQTILTTVPVTSSANTIDVAQGTTIFVTDGVPTNDTVANLDNSGTATGRIVRLVLVSSDGGLTLTESGNMNLSGGGTFAMDQGDIIEFLYDGSNWIEMSRSDN